MWSKYLNNQAWSLTHKKIKTKTKNKTTTKSKI